MERPNILPTFHADPLFISDPIHLQIAGVQVNVGPNANSINVGTVPLDVQVKQEQEDDE